MDFPKILITIGLLLIATGLIFYTIPQAFNWCGKLPGDIKIEKENSKIYFPLSTMIVISIILTILFNLIGWVISRFK